MFVTITRTSEKHSDLIYHHEQECVLHGFTLKEVIGMSTKFEIKIKKSAFSKWQKTSFGKMSFETASELVKKLTGLGCFYSVAKFYAE